MYKLNTSRLSIFILSARFHPFKWWLSFGYLCICCDWNEGIERFNLHLQLNLQAKQLGLRCYLDVFSKVNTALHCFIALDASK